MDVLCTFDKLFSYMYTGTICKYVSFRNGNGFTHLNAIERSFSSLSIEIDAIDSLAISYLGFIVLKLLCAPLSWPDSFFQESRELKEMIFISTHVN